MSFRFKQFTLQQDGASMKMGTDAMLLGAWAHVDDATSALDIGTGTGVLALMIAQRNINLFVTAVELDAVSAEIAQLNFQNSPFKNRLALHPVNIQTYQPKTRYDHIICNPPFFNNGVLAPTGNRRDARHTTTLTHSDLLNAVNRLLTPSGTFATIVPLNVADFMLDNAATYALYPQRITHVKSLEASKPHRALLQFGRDDLVVTKNEFVIYEAHRVFSAEYRTLTAPYHLKH